MAGVGMKTCDFPLPEGVQAFFSDSAQECAGQLALHVAESLRARLTRGRRASLVVSGGSTPLPFFHALADQELAWARVTLLLADEDWKSTRLNSSHVRISYAVFCLKKKKKV